MINFNAKQFVGGLGGDKALSMAKKMGVAASTVSVARKALVSHMSSAKSHDQAGKILQRSGYDATARNKMLNNCTDSRTIVDDHAKLSMFSNAQMKEMVKTVGIAALHNNDNFNKKRRVMSEVIKKFNFKGKAINKEGIQKLFDRGDEFAKNKTKEMVENTKMTDASAKDAINADARGHVSESKKPGDTTKHGQAANPSMKLSSGIKMPSGGQEFVSSDLNYSSIQKTEKTNNIAQNATKSINNKDALPETSQRYGDFS